MKRITLVVALVALVSCGGGSPSAPSAVQVAGTWSGSITSNQVAGSGPARITIAQSGSSLTGTWQVTGPNGPDSGNMTGSMNGSSASMSLTPSVPGTCPYSVTATFAGSSMTGTYATQNCTASGSGGVALTKQ
jgi:hypothetical protein